MFIINTKITKEYILKHITQESIFQKYINIFPVIGNRYKNPLRENKTENTEFYYYNQLLFMIDYGWESEKNIFNCFEIVSYLFNCTYEKSLQIICRDFELFSKPNDFLFPTIQKSIYKYDLENIVLKKNKLNNIKIKVKEFTDKELYFWSCNNKIKVNTKLLNEYNIFSTKAVWYNDKCTISESHVFAYYISKDNFQIYKANEKNRKFKFRSTSLKNVIFYQNRINNNHKLIITKSVKDAFIGQMLGLNICALLNEGTIPTSDKLEELKKINPDITLLFDNDESGFIKANKIAKLYNLKTIFIPDKETKDLWDFVFKYEIEEVQKWIYYNNLI